MSSPKAAWLKKKTSTMGKTRWQSRFFVLLETELRYYKDEYAVTPNYIWHLRDIVAIQQFKTVNCLFLEPQSSKPLTIQFSSDIEMQEWLDHLAPRCLPPSLIRRRGIILSSLTIPQDEGLPSLESTVSTSSSSSSIATLVDQDVPLTKHTLDDAASPSYLKYKNQFLL